MPKERKFYLQPMKNTRTKNTGESFIRIIMPNKSKPFTRVIISRQAVLDALGENGKVPAFGFLTLFEDTSKRIIGFKLERETTLPLSKNQKKVSINKWGTISFGAASFLSRLRPSAKIPTDRLEIKTYPDEIYGKVSYVYVP